MSAGVGLSKHVVYRIFAFGTGSLHKRIAKADLLDLPWNHTMPRNMLDPISWPNEFPNCHCKILIGLVAESSSAKRFEAGTDLFF
jgi:hypothetical protein